MFQLSQTMAPPAPPRDAEQEFSAAMLRLAVVTWPEHAAGIVADWLTDSCDDALADKPLDLRFSEAA